MLTSFVVYYFVLKYHRNSKIELKIEGRAPLEPSKVSWKRSISRNGIIRRDRFPEHVKILFTRYFVWILKIHELCCIYIASRNKLKGSGVRYEVKFCRLCPDRMGNWSVSLEAYNDASIFKSDLKNMVGSYEFFISDSDCSDERCIIPPALMIRMMQFMIWFIYDKKLPTNASSIFSRSSIASSPTASTHHILLCLSEHYHFRDGRLANHLWLMIALVDG